MISPADCSLLVLSDERHFFDGQKYRCELTFDYFLSAIGSHMRRTTVATPVTRTGSPFGQVIDLPHIEFCELPYWTSLASYLRLGRADRRRLRTQVHELVAAHDAVLVRLPSLAAEVFAREARTQRKVLCTFLAANFLTQANPLHSPSRLTRLGARLFTRWVHRKLIGMVRQAQVPLAIGSELQQLSLRHNPASKLFMETLISERDLYQREDHMPRDRPIVLFRAARVEPSKGTGYLIQALGLLVRRGYDVRLRLAGTVASAAYQAELQGLAQTEGVADRIEWLGRVPFGPPLHQLYKEAHIGVLSSLGEGFPRFINEAWAFSLPVVSTRLPSLCPPVVPDQNAVLVDLRSGTALADGVQRVIEDGALRRRIVAGGMQVVREHSLERQSRRVAEYIAAACADLKTGPPC